LLLPYIFLLLSSRLLVAQTVDPALATLLQEKLDMMRTSLNVRSLSAALVLPDNTVWSGATGISAVTPLETATPEHTYALGSITKTITSACILQLADEGVLHLDDSLWQWVAPINFVNPNITIRQLLRHQSGLYDVITDQQYGFVTQTNIDSVWVLRDVVTSFIKAPLFQAGTGWSYSNTNYLLLGMIIEAATNKPYYEVLRERFFDPLNLETVALPAYEPLPDLIAHPWHDLTGDQVQDDAYDFFTNWVSFFTTAGPAGGYFATSADVARWVKAFMSGSLHSADIMAEAKVTVATPTPGPTRYGLGLMERKFSGLTAYGHGGDIIYSSISYYFPEKDISIAVLNNDSKKNSWALAPVVASLLTAYTTFQTSTAASVLAEESGVFVQVYPSPFTDNLRAFVELPSAVAEMRWALSNALGETVATANEEHVPPGRQELYLDNLAALPSGVYYLSTTLDGQMLETVKVIKTNG
jgi:D-alanyl-D-alanine carboxypeptidase